MAARCVSRSRSGGAPNAISSSEARAKLATDACSMAATVAHHEASRDRPAVSGSATSDGVAQSPRAASEAARTSSPTTSGRPIAQLLPSVTQVSGASALSEA